MPTLVCASALLVERRRSLLTGRGAGTGRGLRKRDLRLCKLDMVLLQCLREQRNSRLNELRRLGLRCHEAQSNAVVWLHLDMNLHVAERRWTELHGGLSTAALIKLMHLCAQLRQDVLIVAGRDLA